MSVSDFISLLGGVALFLFGMSIMGDALKKVAGNQLELVLYNLTSTPIKGVLLGTGVTAVIQSSSATSVMVVGFVNSGMMKVNQAIGIVLGAILGTSVTGWVLCLSNLSGGGWVALLSTSTLTALMATIGTLLRMISRKQTTRHVGEILLGFAVLMYGMTAMSGSVEPLRESAVFINAMTSFANPLLGILVGIVFTSVIQSASAAVGILQALAATGAVTFEIALPIIMGIAIGAAVPVLLSALGANVSGKRTAFVYLLIDVLGVVIWGCIFYAVNAVVHFDFMDTTMTTVSIALANTLFRLATVVALMPLIGLLEKLVCMLVPDDSESSRERQKMDRLEERFLQHPALAIEQSRQVTDAMAQCAMENLLAAMALVHQYSDKGFRAVAETESTVDRYEDRLGTYLMKITGKELTARQSEEVSKYLHTISDFERISDHALNISEVAQEIHSKGMAFSEEASRELKVMEDAVSEILYLSIHAFVEGDLAAASRVEPLEEIIDGLCDELKLHHVDRLQKGVCTLSQGFVFNDLLTNFERVADHCSNIAVAMIELESDAFRQRTRKHPCKGRGDSCRYACRQPSPHWPSKTTPGSAGGEIACGEGQSRQEKVSELE